MDDVTNKETQMSTDPFQQLVIQRLDELRDDNKLFLQKLEEHGKEDVVRFETIDQKFSDAATIAAESKGVAKATAKFWGLCAGLPGPIAAGVWAIWKAFHGLK